MPTINAFMNGCMVCAVVAAAFCCTNVAKSQIQITEVHPVPAGGEPEWVELENTSESRIDLMGWWLCDNRTCVRLPLLQLEKGQLAVVARDTVALRESRRVGQGAVIVEAKIPSLNNTTDQVIIRNADSAMVDSASYRVRVRGRSLERSGADWDVCTARDSATCGLLNSNVRLHHDVRVTDAVAGRAPPTVDVVVENWGLRRSTSRLLVLAEPSGREHAHTVPVLDLGQRWTGRFALDDLSVQQGSARFRVWLVGADDRADNDSIEVTLTLPPPPFSIVVSEVMFDPTSGMGDYVEVFNASADTIDLDGWRLADQLIDGHRDTVDILGSLRLLPREFGVIAVDTTVRGLMDDADKNRLALVRRSFNLDADGDDVLLLTNSGFVVDYVRVEAAWHLSELPSRKGISLERLAMDAPGTERGTWASSGSLQGGTPGRENSVAAQPWEGDGELLPVPTPFSTIVGNRLHPCRIGYRQPFRHALIALTVLEPSGNVVRSILNAVYASSEGSVIWDGRDDNNLPVAIGPYIVRLEAIEAGGTRSFATTALVVVGE